MDTALIAQHLADIERSVNRTRKRQLRAWPPGVPQQPEFPLGQVSIPEHLAHWARVFPERAALVFGERTYAYAELDALVDGFAGWLQGEGIRPGDRVGVMLPNCPQFTVAMLGILRVGAVHVPVNPMFRERELRQELTDAGVSVLIALETLSPLVQQVRQHLKSVLLTGLKDPGDDWAYAVSMPAPEPVAADLDAPAALNYTGGTTGVPKGCSHTQRNMLYTAVTAALNLGGPIDPERPQTALIYVPVFWIAGEDFGVLVPIVTGGTCVLLPRWEPKAVLDSIERHSVTSMLGTVDNYVELMDHPDFPKRDLSSLHTPLAMSFVRLITPEIRARWREATGGTLREASYGMTETHTADTFTFGFQEADRDLLGEPGFCGLPVPGTDFVVVDPATAVPLPPGSEGALLIRSPSLLTGYHGHPEVVSATGWFVTGDAGLIDEEGCIHYLGRTKDMIKVNGMTVFPPEVEVLLRTHPEIADVAVVGAPDKEKGEIPVAFVVRTPESTLTEEDLTEWARAQMSTYKVPVVRFTEALPMTATGKVRKGELRAELP